MVIIYSFLFLFFVINAITLYDLTVKRGGNDERKTEQSSSSPSSLSIANAKPGHVAVFDRDGKNLTVNEKFSCTEEGFVKCAGLSVNDVTFDVRPTSEFGVLIKTDKNTIESAPNVKFFPDGKIICSKIRIGNATIDGATISAAPSPSLLSVNAGKEAELLPIESFASFGENEPTKINSLVAIDQDRRIKSSGLGLRLTPSETETFLLLDQDLNITNTLPTDYCLYLTDPEAIEDFKPNTVVTLASRNFVENTNPLSFSDSIFSADNLGKPLIVKEGGVLHPYDDAGNSAGLFATAKDASFGENSIVLFQDATTVKPGPAVKFSNTGFVHYDPYDDALYTTTNIFQTSIEIDKSEPVNLIVADKNGELSISDFAFDVELSRLKPAKNKVATTEEDEDEEEEDEDEEGSEEEKKEHENEKNRLYLTIDPKTKIISGIDENFSGPFLRWENATRVRPNRLIVSGKSKNALRTLSVPFGNLDKIAPHQILSVSSDKKLEFVDSPARLTINDAFKKEAQLRGAGCVPYLIVESNPDYREDEDPEHDEQIVTLGLSNVFVNDADELQIPSGSITLGPVKINVAPAADDEDPPEAGDVLLYDAEKSAFTFRRLLPKVTKPDQLLGVDAAGKIAFVDYEPSRHKYVEREEKRSISVFGHAYATICSVDLSSDVTNFNSVSCSCATGGMWPQDGDSDERYAVLFRITYKFKNNVKSEHSSPFLALPSIKGPSFTKYVSPMVYLSDVFHNPAPDDVSADRLVVTGVDLECTSTDPSAPDQEARFVANCSAKEYCSDDRFPDITTKIRIIIL